MIKAVIVLEDWKLPIFRKRLESAGFEYKDKGAFTVDSTMLHVETDDLSGLNKVLKNCYKECEKLKRGK